MELYLFTNAEHPSESDSRARVEEHVRHAQQAVEAGFVGVAVGQHLSMDDLQWFPPIPLASYIAARVPEARIAVTVVLVPYFNPFLLAESLAFLDVLTDGRLSLGVAAGWAEKEFRALGLSRADRIEHFTRNMKQLSTLLAGGAIELSDEEGGIEEVTLGLRPLQRPRPPVWLGASGPRTARQLAPMADALVMSAHPPLERQVEVLDAFRSGQGGATSPEPNAIVRNVFVGDSREQAVADAMPYLRSSYEAFGDWGLFSTVLGEPASQTAFEDTVLSRVIIGDPDDVALGLRLTQERLGTPRLILRMQWRGMASSRVERSLRMFRQHVMPQLDQDG